MFVPGCFVGRDMGHDECFVRHDGCVLRLGELLCFSAMAVCDELVGRAQG